MKQYNVMLKPASSLCNLRCRYCFYCDVADLREVRSFGIMTDETMQNVLRSLERSLSPGDQITVISQGGEPMLAGLDFFRRFAARTDGWDPGISVSFALQTNGMLLDHDWCAFLKERRVLVGLSYDMLEDLHDGARVDASSRGTNRRVLESMRLLQKTGVEFNILCTLTNPIARHPEKVWRRMEQLNVRFVQFTPCLDALETPGESQYALTPKRFAGFYNTLFPLWLAAYQKGQYRSVKLFDDVIHRLAFGSCNMCGLDGQCRAQLVVEADGSVYPCDFYCLDEYRLGNLCEKTIPELLAAPQAETFLQRPRESPALCARCEFRRFCGGFCKRMQREVCCTGDGGFCGYREFLMQNLPALQQLAQLERRYQRK